MKAWPMLGWKGAWRKTISQPHDLEVPSSSCLILPTLSVRGEKGWVMEITTMSPSRQRGKRKQVEGLQAARPAARSDRRTMQRMRGLHRRAWLDGSSFEIECRVCVRSAGRRGLSQWSKLTQKENFRKARRILPGFHVPKTIRRRRLCSNSQRHINIMFIAESGAENRIRGGICSTILPSDIHFGKFHARHLACSRSDWEAT